jgi:hypothetical protein
MTGDESDDAFLTAQQAIIDGYKQLNITGTALKDSIRFKRHDTLLYIGPKAIQSYARVHGEDHAVGPGECSLAGPDFFEMAVRAAHGPYIRHRFPELKLRGPSGSGVRIRLGDCSDDFLNRHRFQPRLSSRLRHGYLGLRPRATARTPGGTPKADFDDQVFHPYTIRLDGLKTTSGDDSKAVGASLMDATLFYLSQARDVALEPQDSWTPVRPPGSSFRRGPQPDKDDLQLPAASFNPRLCRYYRRAMAAPDPVNRFLALYQVLEHEFFKVADADAIAAIQRSLRKYVVDGKDRHIEEILRDAGAHSRTLGDETALLEAVLKRIATEPELIDYIDAYEKHIRSQPFTKQTKATIFGKSCWITKESRLVHGEVAKRIKHLRNVLVHSSDRHERGEVFIPGNPAMEAVVEQELPLLQFLAEQAVLQSARFGPVAGT